MQTQTRKLERSCRRSLKTAGSMSFATMPASWALAIRPRRTAVTSRCRRSWNVLALSMLWSALFIQALLYRTHVEAHKFWTLAVGTCCASIPSVLLTSLAHVAVKSGVFLGWCVWGSKFRKLPNRAYEVPTGAYEQWPLSVYQTVKHLDDHLTCEAYLVATVTPVLNSMPSILDLPQPRI